MYNTCSCRHVFDKVIEEQEIETRWDNVISDAIDSIIICRELLLKEIEEAKVADIIEVDQDEFFKIIGLVPEKGKEEIL